MLNYLSQHVSYVYIGVAGALLIFFFMGKKQKSQGKTDDSSGAYDDYLSDAGPVERSSNKALYFNFSGHMWDAFEVLGVTPESTELELERAYDEALDSLEGTSREFIDLAYRVIREKR